MVRWARFGVLLLFGVLCVGQPATHEAGLDSERLARIPVRMKEFADRGAVSGAVTLVARHGKVAELDAVGYQDIENKTRMDTGTIFQIMSMTKPFTGVGIMMLFEEGRLGLNDPVSRHLPEYQEQAFANGQKPRRPVTIRDLMTHTSGMLDGSEDELMGIIDQMRMPLAEAVSLYAKKPLEFEPDTKWKYSSPGIAVLGRIIEVTSGMAYEQFISERLLRPLGMIDSFFFAPAGKQRRIAMVYHRQDGKLVRASEHILGGNPAEFRKGAHYPAPEWGLYSTASDLFAFYQMMLNGGSYKGRRYLSRPAVDLMTQIYTSHIPNSSWLGGAGYGLTWEVAKDPPGTFLLHSPGTYGHGGAFGTQGWIDPKRDLIRILLVQSADDGAGPVRNAFMAMAASAITD